MSSSPTAHKIVLPFYVLFHLKLPPSSYHWAGQKKKSFLMREQHFYHFFMIIIFYFLYFIFNECVVLYYTLEKKNMPPFFVCATKYQSILWFHYKLKMIRKFRRWKILACNRGLFHGGDDAAISFVSSRHNFLTRANNVFCIGSVARSYILFFSLILYLFVGILLFVCAFFSLSFLGFCCIFASCHRNHRWRYAFVYIWLWLLFLLPLIIMLYPK